MEMIKIVQVKHPGCGVAYTFRAPEEPELKPGEYILCKTRRNPLEIGQCITPSFDVTKDQLENLYGIAEKNLKPVVGGLNPEMFFYKKAAEE